VNILIAPWARRHNKDKHNPKDYPYWEEVVKQLTGLGHFCLQISCTGEPIISPNILLNQPLDTISMLVKSYDLWISIDSFLQHLAHKLGKRGIVIWGPSNPTMFGYKENINILPIKQMNYPQFYRWDMVEPDPSIFALPEEVVKVTQAWLP
jgi:ADP-heptose:LPS heptosyltransferase